MYIVVAAAAYKNSRQPTRNPSGPRKQLLILLAQCAWLVNRSRFVAPEAHEISRIREGLGEWRGHWIASTPSAARTQQSVGDEPFDSHHSALWYLIASAPSLLLRGNT